MVDYATMSTYTNQIANGKYSSQLAKLQAFQNILTIDYKWSHREMKQLLIDIIETFDSINGSGSAGSAGFDIDNPNSWKDHNSSSDNNNGGTGSGGSGSSGGNIDAITEEKILELLKKHADQISPTIDVEKIVKTTQEEIINSKLFKDLVSQLVGNGINGLTRAIEEEEHARVSGDAQVLKQAAEKVAKEAADRVDAIANEAAVRARQFAEEATNRTNEILEESKRRIAADEAEIQARKDAINKEAEARTAAIQKETTDRVEAIRSSAQTAQDNLLAESKKLGTKITNLESVTADHARQISTISASNHQNVAAAIQEEKDARIAADEAEARARQTLAAKVQQDIAAGISTEQSARASDNAAQAKINTNLSAKLRDVESAITTEQSARIAADSAQTEQINQANSRIGNVESNITTIERTIADNNQAFSTKIEGLKSQFGDVNVGGRNLFLGTKSKIIESTGNSNTINVRYDFSPNVDVETLKDFVFSCEMELHNAQFQSGTTNGRIGLEVKLEYTDNSVEYKDFWFTDLTTPKTVKQKLKSEKVTSNPDKTLRRVSGILQVRNVSSTSLKVYNVKLEKGNVFTDWSEAPEDIGAEINAASAKVDTAKSTLASADEALARRIDTLNSTFNANKADIDSKYQTLADKDSALTNQIETLKTSVNNNSAAIQREQTARTSQDSAIATQINGLTTKFNQANAAITAEATTRADSDTALTTKIDRLTTRVGNAESAIRTEQTTRADADRATSARIDTLNSAHENTKAAVNTLTNTVATNKEAAASELKKVNAKVKDAETAISTETTARTREDSALGTRIDTVQSNLNKANAAITQESQTRATNDEANSRAIRTVQSDLDTTNANLTREQQARTTKDEALTRDISGLTTRLGSAEGRITTEENTRATADEALSQKLTQLTSNFNQANAALTTLQSTVTRQDQARAQEISTLSAKLGDMRIGGRNYFRETGNLLDTTMWRFAKDSRQTQAEVVRQRDILTLTAATAYWTVYSQRGQDNPLINFDSDEVITVSFEAHSSVTTRDFIQFSFRQHYRGGQTNVVKRFTPTETNKWLKYSYTFVTPVKNPNFVQFEAIFEIGQVGTVKFRKLKIERGNVATDWTEAPEDMTRLNESTAAELNAYKNAQATKEDANTKKLDGAISRIGTSESKISNLETTRANKNEVAALARNTLKAEWDKAVSDAKNALSGEITETKRVATQANNTASALYSLKVQTSANGKKNVAGLMLGANEVESQFGVVADSFYITSGNFRKTPFTVKENDIFFNGKVYFANEKNLIPNPRFAMAADGVVGGVGRMSVTSDVLGGYTTQFLSHKGVGGSDWTGVGADGDTESIVKTSFHSTGANQSWWFDTVEFIFDNKDGIPGRRYTFSALANAYRSTCLLLVEEIHPVNKLQYVKLLGKSEEIGIGSSKANAPTNGPDFRRGIESAKTGRRLWCEFTWPNEGAVRISIRGNNIKADRPDIYSARWKLVEGTGEESRKWLADTGTMIDGSTIVSGTINGSHIKAKSIISAPYIIGGSLNIADRFKVMSNGDVLIQAASGNTGMKITSERIDVYDTSGRLRVRMGKLS